MSLHELGHDLVLADEFGFELLDSQDIGVAGGSDLAAVFEGQVGVLEELTLPQVEQGGVDLELIAHGGDGDAFEKVAFDDGDLLLGGEMAASLLVGQGVIPPYRLC